MMNPDGFKNRGRIKQGIFCLLLFCLSLCLNRPFILYASPVCCVYDDENEQRTQMARCLAGVTLIGLGVGAGCLASCSGHRRHHGSSCSCSSYYYPSSYSNSSCWSSSSSSSSCSSSYSSSSSCRILKNAHKQRSVMPSEASLAASTQGKLAGTFTITPSLSALGHGGLIVFVLLPDGTKQVLGRILFSDHTGSSLSYGPFDQAGTYTLGVTLDEGSEIYTQALIGYFDLSINGTFVQTCEVILSPYDQSALYFYHN